MITFAVDKKDVDSGQFPINHLKQFTMNTDSKVIIRSYAEIVNGEIKYFQ